MPPTLIDTNVLVYTFDQNEPARQQQAIEVLRALEQSGDGRLSVQCLAEFCAVAMRRLRPPLSPEATLAQVERFQRAFAVYSLTPMIVTEALRGVRAYQLPYYDAQIWATARLNQVPLVFSEDFNPSTLEGVQFINPFDPGFTISHWQNE